MLGIVSLIGVFKQLLYGGLNQQEVFLSSWLVVGEELKKFPPGFCVVSTRTLLSLPQKLPLAPRLSRVLLPERF